MADAESLRHIAQSRTPFSAWLGVMLLFALFGGIVLAIIGPSPRGDAYEQKRAKAREEKIKVVRDEEKSLTNYSWVDKAKGSVRIPISHAMELTVAELSQKKPAAAGPIATPVPPAPAAAPAAPAITASPRSTSSGTPKPSSVSGPHSEAANQPAAAINPPPAPPGSQPGASPAPTAKPGPTHPASPTPAPSQPAN